MKEALLLVLLMVGIFCSAQTDSSMVAKTDQPRLNAVYGEIAGNGGLFSVNYERVLFNKDNERLIGRVGYGLLFNILFVEGNYVFGQKHGFEHGLSYGHDFENHWIMYYRIGYRYSGEKGFLFRVAPLFAYNKFSGDPSPVSVWYGVSLGRSF